MKILHSADWHLGRYLHGASLLEDQRLILDQFFDLARTEQVDVVVIAGDIYDRAIPPSEAVALLDSVLTRLVVDAGIPTIVIAGNHDSAERIGFGGRIFAQRGLTLRGTLNNLSPVVLSDAHGEVAFHPLPYVEPLFARHLPGGEDVTDHQAAMTHLMSLLKAQRVPGQRNVLVGHAFVTGGSESDSERPLSVGGSGRVGADSFDGFDFVALGHLHRPQSIGSDRIQYSGSLLKYSFNEVDQAKSVSLVELGADGVPVTKRVALKPRRDLRIITGTLVELLGQPDAVLSRDDYLCAQLTDTSPVLEPMLRLREVYPNILDMQLARQAEGQVGAISGGDHRQRKPEDLFRAFHRDMLGEEISPQALDVFNQSVQSLAGESQGRPS